MFLNINNSVLGMKKVWSKQDPKLIIDTVKLVERLWTNPFKRVVVLHLILPWVEDPDDIPNLPD